MKKIILLLIIGLTVFSCEGSGNSDGSGGSEYCSYNGHTLHTGEKGGCYYINSSGDKVYVDKSYCKGCY
ncbi:hypothetical protein BN1195_00978 [Chryseobacterium oranimense G311]|uniref:hypothetical protein n=1 Tax=Chryseobacterium oranimense TaxID=421058 RepID=UPI0005339FD3|nr:hypothetical protein [Chryseobacterium oranimense]CEJ68689.1 hypothetical protein BN1195_00978 [Chryseobacterium oranimense G311]